MGGWCPQGRRAEDGCIPACYRLQETPSSTYAVRTEWNIRDTDATAIFSLSSVIRGGTDLTRQLVIQAGKPWVHVYSEMGIQTAATSIYDFVLQTPIVVLNLAGPRESEEPMIGNFLTQVMIRAFVSSDLC